MKWVASFAKNMPCTKCPLRYPSQAAPSNCATRQAVCPSAEGTVTLRLHRNPKGNLMKGGLSHEYRRGNRIVELIFTCFGLG